MWGRGEIQELGDASAQWLLPGSLTLGKRLGRGAAPQPWGNFSIIQLWSIPKNGQRGDEEAGRRQLQGKTVPIARVRPAHAHPALVQGLGMRKELLLLLLPLLLPLLLLLLLRLSCSHSLEALLDPGQGLIPKSNPTSQ